MKAIYTDAAKQALESFRDRQQRLLEDLVSERKLVLGDEILEITASDIKAASERIQIYRPIQRRSQLTEIVTRAYIVIGISMMAGAFFYPQLIEIYYANKSQALLFLMGAFMAAVGWVYSFYVQSRLKRMEAEAYRAMRLDADAIKLSDKYESESNEILQRLSDITKGIKH